MTDGANFEQQIKIPTLDGKTEHHSSGMLDEFLKSAVYSGVQEPLVGVTQLVDHVAGTDLAKSVTFMNGPSKAAFGSKDWYAQTIGGAVGMLAPFLAVKAGMKPLLGEAAVAEGAGMLSRQAVIGMSLKEAALTGFTYSALLQPSQGQGVDFWKNRLANGAIGAAQFGALTAGSLGMSELADSAAARSMGLSSALRNPILAGAASGVPSGLLASEMNSLYYNHKLASRDDMVQTAASMALIGGVFGAHQELTNKAPAIAERGRQVAESARQNVDAMGRTLADLGRGMEPQPAFAFADAGFGDTRLRSADLPDGGRSFMKMTTVGPEGTGGGGDAGAVVDGKVSGDGKTTGDAGTQESGIQPVTGKEDARPGAGATDQTAAPVDPAQAEKDAVMKAAADAAKQRGAVARGEMESLGAKFVEAKPTTESLSSLYDVLSRNPEVDEHIKDLYKRNFDNPVMMEAIEGFYKPAPESSLSLLQDPQMADAYSKLSAIVSDPRNSGVPQRIFQRDLQIFLNTRVSSQLTPEQELNARLGAVKYFARTSTDPVAVAAADAALKPLLDARGEQSVDHVKLLQDFVDHQRQLPMTPQDINEALGYSRAEKNALEGRPLDAADPHTDQTGIGGVGSDSSTTTATPVELPAEVKAKIDAKVDARVGELRDKLNSEDTSVSEQAALGMMSHLNHASAQEWFPRWRDVIANDVVMDSSALKSEEVLALGDQPVRDFLSGDWKGKGYGRDATEQLEAKLGALKATAQAFTPETAAKLLELGKADPAGLMSVLEATKTPGGQDYQEWVNSTAAQATSFADLTGDAAALPLAKFRLSKAFPTDTATVDKLLAMKAADPNFDIDSLASSVNNPKIGEAFRKALLSNLGEGDPRTLTADYIFTQMRIEKAYAKNEAAVARLKELAKEDPLAMKDILMDPRAAKAKGGRDKRPPTPEEKKLSFAYGDLIGELAPQATSLEQLKAVTDRLKSGDKAGAWNAAKAIKPADAAAWSNVQDWIKAVATGDPAHLPQRQGKKKPVDEQVPAGGDLPVRPPDLPQQPVDQPPVDSTDGGVNQTGGPPEEPGRPWGRNQDSGDPSKTIPDPNLDSNSDEEYPSTEYPEQSGLDYPGAKMPEGMGKDGPTLPPEIGRWVVGPTPEDLGQVNENAVESAGKPTVGDGTNGQTVVATSGDGQAAVQPRVVQPPVQPKLQQTAAEIAPETYAGPRSGKRFTYDDGEEDYGREKKIKKAKGGGRDRGERRRGGSRNWTSDWMNGEFDD